MTPRTILQAKDLAQGDSFQPQTSFPFYLSEFYFYMVPCCSASNSINLVWDLVQGSNEDSICVKTDIIIIYKQK